MDRYFNCMGKMEEVYINTRRENTYIRDIRKVITFYQPCRGLSGSMAVPYL